MVMLCRRLTSLAAVLVLRSSGVTVKYASDDSENNLHVSAV